MKAITLTQPWATLVAKGEKKIETRSWSVKYRGPLAIHAAKGFPKWAQQMCYGKFFVGALFPDYDGRWQSLPTGAIVATCNLVHVKFMEEHHVFPACKAYYWQKREWLLDEKERAFGEYAVGRYMWLLEDVVMLPEPIPAKGALGLWNWERETEAA